MADENTVQVALRIRPLVEHERSRGCKKRLEAIPNENQIHVSGTDKSFTYNHVFDEHISQQGFYDIAVKQMVRKLFKGYNVTILAYGRTGSGKTYTMGTCYDGAGEMGVIPRAVFDLFQYMSGATDSIFTVSVSYMELYQENLYDLLSNRPREQCVVDIREDSKGIKIPGLVDHAVTNAKETIKYLIRGSKGRATGATAMNAKSSRSHAIFTITVIMRKKDDTNSMTTSKFHLVDLAGSERSKKTKATGERFREGININKELLVLGNVISALSDGTQKGYIPYRDSKLTRLLQDSLGGNSITLMIACVSPADYSLDETISTLRYADRARKVKNKPIVNQDPQAAEIARLHQMIQQLRVDRIDVSSGSGGGGGDGDNGNSDGASLSKMKDEIVKLQNKNRDLNNALSSALTENTAMFERALLTQTANERLQKKILELKETLSNLTVTMEQNADCPTNIKDHVNQLENMIVDLQTEHKRNEEEIQKHEYQCQTNAPRLNQQAAVDHDLHNCQPDLDERQERHTKEQLNLKMELQELDRVLALKEQLATQIMANANHMVDYAAMTENEVQITALEKEKDELRNIKSSAASSKIAEQRRKRVKELETHISELNKKVIEQARMIKLKENDESKIKQLSTEIEAMKANKVKLIKTMRVEEQKFKTWKMQDEKDLMRLKDQDRKRQNQTVLKRKVEEAVAINNILKDALELQKQAQDRRGQHYGKTDRIEQWVAQELEVHVSTIDAERTLEQLLEDRALVIKQLCNLRNNTDIADTPEGRENICHLTDDIELRSAQIADLQQKIIDSDQGNENKAKTQMLEATLEKMHTLRIELNGYKEEVELLREKLIQVNSIAQRCENKPGNVKPEKVVHTILVNDTLEEINSTMEDVSD